MTTATAAPAAPAATKEIDAKTAKRMLDAGEAVLIDVRERDENAAERIAGSSLHPLSSFDCGPLLGHGDRTVLFHCRSGRRSLDALGRYTAGGGRRGASLAGGIEGWKAAGLAVERSKAPPISLMRQVQIVIGFMVLAGTSLGFWVHPGFLAIPAFMGAGLLFAGLSGTCGLAAVLARMPWNRFECPGGSCSA
jgi:rhodanese-related sulfurtransferase